MQSEDKRFVKSSINEPSTRAASGIRGMNVVIQGNKIYLCEDSCTFDAFSYQQCNGANVATSRSISNQTSTTKNYVGISLSTLVHPYPDIHHIYIKGMFTSSTPIIILIPITIHLSIHSHLPTQHSPPHHPPSTILYPTPVPSAQSPHLGR